MNAANNNNSNNGDDGRREGEKEGAHNVICR